MPKLAVVRPVGKDFKKQRPNLGEPASLHKEEQRENEEKES